ncbi:glycosyltransferase family 2 protein [Synechococcus sp. AH-601-O06]|nr:glycosyltransferase family 2 protein [Synechococcus sp. AH-601-O06]
MTVVIRVKNEEQWIGAAIQSVVDHAPFSKLIIIDNNSTDDSIKVAKLFKHDTARETSERYLDMQIINIDDYTPGKALNMAANICETKYLLALSSHCEIVSLKSEAFDKINDNCVAIFGKQVPKYFGKKISHKYIWSNYSNSSMYNMYSTLEDRYFFHNAFSAFNAKFLRKNPFDEELVGKEDRYWANDIISNGHRIFYDSSMVCYHHFTINGNTWRGVD